MPVQELRAQLAGAEGNAQASAETKEPVVIGTEETFRSGVNRCEMLDDVGWILQRSPKCCPYDFASGMLLVFP